MANEQLITVIGRLAQDPEVRFLNSGGGVANFAIAFTPQKFNRDTNEWADGTPTFWRCAAFDQGKLTRAQNIGDTLKKGDAVIAHGILESRAWEDKEGNKRTSLELNVKAIGKDLTFHGQAYAKNQPPAQEQGGWANDSEAPF